MLGNLKRSLVGTLILCVLFVSGTVAAWDFLSCEYTRIGWFNLPHDTTIDVYVQTSSEITISYSYQIVRSGEIIVPRTNFLYAPTAAGLLEFHAVTAKGGDLIGLVSTERPTVWLMAHELSSGRLLLRAQDDGEGLLAELRSEPPGSE